LFWISYVRVRFPGPPVLNLYGDLALSPEKAKYSHSPVNELHWSMSQSTFLGSAFGRCSSIFFHCIDMYWLYNIPDSCSCPNLRSSDNSKWSPMWYNCEFTFQAFHG